MMLLRELSPSLIFVWNINSLRALKQVLLSRFYRFSADVALKSVRRESKVTAYPYRKRQFCGVPIHPVFLAVEQCSRLVYL